MQVIQSRQTPKNQIFYNFFSTKSVTLNPENAIKKLQQQDEDSKILSLTATRAKQRIKQTASTKYRLSLSSKSEALKRSNFQPSLTISTIVRDRHAIQQKTNKLNNFCNYLSNRFKQQTKKKELKKQKQSRIKQTISSNKSQKSLMQTLIQQYNQEVYTRKLNSKSVIIEHKKKLVNIINKNKLEKQRAGSIGRNQMKHNHTIIQAIKKDWEHKNKQAAERGKSIQQIYQQRKIQRENEKRKIANQNYRRRWMKQFVQKQRIQRQNRIKSRRLNKKIQYLIEETQKAQFQ